MQKIGRYQVEHELGRGAMGVVYRAYDPAIGRRVAVKTIPLDSLSDPKSWAQNRERLLREAQSAGILSHPNIVTIYDIAEDAANVYIFMEYVEGSTLDHFSRGMPSEDFLDLLHQAALALDYAHGKGIIHRDIKPANIMLSGRKLKITDFGVARSLHHDSTQSGTLLGTPSYMSPEQISGADVSGASDQYSLAVIAYEFLAGAKPFENANLATLLFKIAHEDPAPISSLPASANEILLRALAKDPARRFATCREFTDSLAASLGHVIEEDTPARTLSGDEPTLMAAAPPKAAAILPPSRQPFDETPVPERRSVWPKLLVFLVLAVAAGAALWYYLGAQRAGEAPVAQSSGLPTAADASSAAPPKPSAVGEAVPTPPSVELTSTSPATATESKAPAVAAPEKGTVPQKEVLNAKQSYQVAFTSNPDGAEILVNDGNVDRCRATPCTLELAAGTYKITGRRKDFPDVTRNLRVPESSLLHLVFELVEGMLSVNSSPSGASIRLNGREILEKTPAMLKLKPGTYKVEVIKEGLPTQSREVTVSDGTVQSLSVKWN